MLDLLTLMALLKFTIVKCISLPASPRTGGIQTATTHYLVWPLNRKCILQEHTAGARGGPLAFGKGKQRQASRTYGSSQKQSVCQTHCAATRHVWRKSVTGNEGTGTVSLGRDMKSVSSAGDLFIFGYYTRLSEIISDFFVVVLISFCWCDVCDRPIHGMRVAYTTNKGYNSIKWFVL